MSVKIVAHRGESLIAPENTLESFTLAWMRGARAVEGDFHLTADGEIICMHDDNTRRTCGIDKPIAIQTLAEIKQLDAGVWKAEGWKFTRVPTLEEVLRTLPDYGEIFIELKSVGPILDRLETIVNEGPWRPEQLTFIAFDGATISEVKRRFPDHHAYWLLCNRLDEESKPKFTPEELVAKVRELGVDGVDIHPVNLTAEYVTALHEAGLSCNVWTVDDSAEARALCAMGVDSITTNCAGKLSGEL